MIQRPPKSTRPDTLFPPPTLFLSRPAAPASSLHPARASLRRSRHVRSARRSARPTRADRRGWRSRPECRHAVHRAASATKVPAAHDRAWKPAPPRSEEHTSELQSLMRISYADVCLKKKKKTKHKKIKQ